MVKTGSKKIISALIIIILPLTIFFFVPGGMLDMTSTPEFCNLCHVMAEQYEVWFQTGVHRNIKCVDCHLPNNNIASHLVWKAIDGTKDVLYFYSRMFSDRISATDHSKKTIQENCARCHDNMVSRLVFEERECWSCHRRITHKFADFSYSEIK